MTLVILQTTSKLLGKIDCIGASTMFQSKKEKGKDYEREENI